MPIKLKVARTAKELDDVFKLRYDVYVSDRNKFSEKRATSDGRIIDQFDTLPDVANVVAYDGDVAIAAFRVNKDSVVGLASEKYFDFDHARKIIRESYNEGDKPLCIVSGSMLAIRKSWRHKRNVIFALFKKTAAVMHSWGASHVFGAASAESFSLYGRLGFEALAGERWVESVGDKMVPMMASFEKVFAWAFGREKPLAKNFWRDKFCTDYDTVLLSPGEVLFREKTQAEYVYSIERGGITLSREGPNQKNVVIAELGQGELFGELAVFDNDRRSTTATAMMNTEIVAIERVAMLDMIHQDPIKLDQLLKHFAHKLRQTEHLAMVQQFSPQTSRVSYALEQLWCSAKSEEGHSSSRVFKIGAEQIAQRAQVRESEVRRVLEMRRVSGGLDYSDDMVLFFRAPSSEDAASLGSGL